MSPATFSGCRLVIGKLIYVGGSKMNSLGCIESNEEWSECVMWAKAPHINSLRFVGSPISTRFIRTSTPL